MFPKWPLDGNISEHSEDRATNIINSLLPHPQIVTTLTSPAKTHLSKAKIIVSTISNKASQLYYIN